MVAQAGAKDVLEGTKVLAASQDIAAQSLAAAALSDEDLDIGLTLAGIAGQLGAVTGVVESLGTSAIVGFLDARSEQLKQLAGAVILRAGATGALARALAETSTAVAELGEAEVAEGEVKFATSRQEADESEELAGEGLGLMMMGMAEAAEAQDLQEESDEMTAEGDAKSRKEPRRTASRAFQRWLAGQPSCRASSLALTCGRVDVLKGGEHPECGINRQCGQPDGAARPVSGPNNRGGSTREGSAKRAGFGTSWGRGANSWHS